MKFLILLLLLLPSCQSVAVDSAATNTNPLIVARTNEPIKYNAPADMAFTIDGIAYTGTAVVTHKTPRNFRFTLPKNVDFIDIKTCHRHIRFPVTGATYDFYYVPRPLVENVRECTMFVDAVTKDGFIKSAEIDFTDKETLTAWNNCNGSIETTKGAGICQADVGLKQMLQVTEPVDVVTNENRCNPMTCTGIFCYYLMSPNDCIYAVKALKSGERYRLVTRGYIMSLTPTK